MYVLSPIMAISSGWVDLSSAGHGTARSLIGSQLAKMSCFFIACFSQYRFSTQDNFILENLSTIISLTDEKLSRSFLSRISIWASLVHVVTIRKV